MEEWKGAVTVKNRNLENMKILPEDKQAAFKLWMLAFIFSVITFHVFDAYYYPAVILLSDRVILSTVLFGIGYLWIQELRDRQKILLINERLVSTQKRLEQAHLSTINTLVFILEGKDPYTRGHSERVTQYSIAIAKELGLSPKDVATIERAGKLHDIGKLGVDEAILCKPGPLTEKERAIINTHPQMGTAILESLDFLSKERVIIRHHHERYDGNGYPDRLRGEEIPIGARIMCLTDAFDAMKSKRSYRNPLPDEKVLSEIEKNAGTQFDPKIVAAFLSLIKKDPQVLSISLLRP